MSISTNEKPLLFFLSLLLLAASCNTKEEKITIAEPEPIIIPSAYEAIKNRGDTLVALVVNSSTSYFIHKGHTAGYEYEMLNKLAEHLNLALKIKLIDDMDSLFCFLNRGDGDLIAHSMVVTNEKREIVNFTHRLYDSPLCLVQKKPNHWQNLPSSKLNNSLIRNVLDIGQKAIYVEQGSYHYSHLLKLSDEIGDSLNITPVAGVSSAFDLIELVANDKIKFTIADQEIASIYAAFDKNIDFITHVSMPHKKAWAVRKNSPKLKTDINAWLKKYKRYKEYYFIYDKYFNNPNTYKKIAQSNYSSRTGELSPYDAIIRQESETLNWDWLLLASQIYQESHFKQDRISWMGAVGLMQVLPATAEMHGFKNLNHVSTNVKAGVTHLRYIEKNFADLDSLNRIKFTLAAYNVGLGHIYDAQRLASYLGKNPLLWDDNVAEALLLKSQKKYYELPECRNGYCRGAEPYNYVNEILVRYGHYKTLID